MYVFILGKFLQGICAGIFTVVCPGFVNDMTPVEMLGPIGGINQFMCTLGIMVVSIMSLPIPGEISTISVHNREYADEFIVAQYWRIITLFPALIGLIQVVLLLSCFNEDSPKEMKK